MKWAIILFSEATRHMYIESQHRWRLVAWWRMRRHRLFGAPTWQMWVERYPIELYAKRPA